MSIRETKAALRTVFEGTGVSVQGVKMQYGGEKRMTQILTVTLQRPGEEPEDVVLEVAPGADLVTAALEYGQKIAEPIKVAKAEAVAQARLVKGA